DVCSSDLASSSGCVAAAPEELSVILDAQDVAQRPRTIGRALVVRLRDAVTEEVAEIGWPPFRRSAVQPAAPVGAVHHLAELLPQLALARQRVFVRTAVDVPARDELGNEVRTAFHDRLRKQR